MRVLPASKASESLDRLIDELSETGETIYIASGKAVAVLVSAEEWSGIQETLYLMSIPGMRESIPRGDGGEPRGLCRRARLVSGGSSSRERRPKTAGD